MPPPWHISIPIVFDSKDSVFFQITAARTGTMSPIRTAVTHNATANKEQVATRRGQPFTATLARKPQLSSDRRERPSRVPAFLGHRRRPRHLPTLTEPVLPGVEHWIRSCARLAVSPHPAITLFASCRTGNSPLVLAALVGSRLVRPNMSVQTTLFRGANTVSVALCYVSRQ